MKYLYILYDSQCGLCSGIRRWIDSQRQRIPLIFVVKGSETARRILPLPDTGDLAVVGSDGRYWIGDHAFIMVLYALRDYRDWARRLAKPALVPIARAAFALLSSHRHTFTKWLALASDAEIAARLKPSAPAACERNLDAGQV